MNVKAILDNKGSDVATIGAAAAVASAVNLLAERGVGALVVLGAGLRVIGIISEQDIVRVLAERGAAALHEPVGQVMNRKVATCNRRDMTSSIMRRMMAGKFHHLPVVEKGQLIGIVSIGDVARLSRTA